MIWFTVLAVQLCARADVLIEKHLAAHCGVLLTATAHASAADTSEVIAILRGALPAATESVSTDERYADVQRVDGLDLGPHADATSHRRLEELIADLARPGEVPAVTFVHLGNDQIAQFIRNLDARVMPLDRAVRRAARAARLDPRRFALEAFVAGTLVGAAAAIGGGDLDPRLGAPLESAALVGAAFVARDSLRRLVGAVFPRRRLDLDRVRVDSHLRLITGAAERGGTIATHIGLSVPITRELRETLLRTRNFEGLDLKGLARLLAETPSVATKFDRAVVDHITVPTPAGYCLLSAVRLPRGELTSGVRRRAARSTWLAQPAYR